MNLRNILISLITFLILFSEVPAYGESLSSKSDTIIPLEPFGRLFTTQQQRQALDKARRNGGTVQPEFIGVDENPVASSVVATAQPVKLMGVLLRADGKNKVWVSGGSNFPENTVNSHAIAGSRTQSANVKVPLRGLNSNAILKPGQVWDASKGRVEEAYQIPVPKSVVIEPVPESIVEKSSATSASSTQTSSVSSSEVHSSVQSSTK